MARRWWWMDGKITAIGPDAELGDVAANAKTVIDGHGMLVMPGLINTHCPYRQHALSRACRGPAA